MKKFTWWATTLIVGLAVSLLTAAGEGATRTKAAASKTAAPKVETYAVVKDGETIQVVKKSELVGLKKKAAEDYKSAFKAYQEAKKASKNKDSAQNKDAAQGKELVKPVKHNWTTLKDSFKTEEDAKAWMDDLLQKREELKTSKKTDGSQ